MSGFLETGLRDSLITRELHESLTDQPDRLLIEQLQAADAVERLGKHLLTVARRMRTPTASDAPSTNASGTRTPAGSTTSSMARAVTIRRAGRTRSSPLRCPIPCSTDATGTA